MRTHRRCLSCLFALPLLGVVLSAQEARLEARPADKVQRLSIAVELESTAERKMLIDGEEPDFGGGGGRGFGGGATSSTRKIVFEQAPAGESWRSYVSLDAVEERPDFDGETAETPVVGGLSGKKVELSRDESGNTVLYEGDGEDRKAVDADLSRGVPYEFDLGGVLPGKTVAVGAEFELGPGFRKLLPALLHPVTPAREAPADGERGRGGRGRGGWRGRGGGDTVAAQLLGSEGLDCEATGKLVELKEVDGRSVAVLELTATVSGAGDAEELGLRMGFGGPGGRGGRGEGGDAGSTIVEADIALHGQAWFDVAAGAVTRLELDGTLAYQTDMQRKMSFGGEDREMQMFSDTKTTVAIVVTSAAVDSQ